MNSGHLAKSQQVLFADEDIRFIRINLPASYQERRCFFIVRGNYSLSVVFEKPNSMQLWNNKMADASLRFRSNCEEAFDKVLND